MLPNFLVIGPGKSGTTWIYHALKAHPQVCVSSAKETLFFETEFLRGIDWYKGFFSHCRNDAKAVGEVSNTYIFCKEAPQRIVSVNPDMKIITCLRNPIERTFSHYLFLIRGGQFTGTFREALEAYPHLVEKGKYYNYLKPYFDHFKNENICIELFDHLKENERKFISRIYNFLEVDPYYIPKVDEKNRFSAAKPRNRLLALAVKKGARLMRAVGHPEVISKIKYSSIPNLLYKEYKKDEKPIISPGDRNFLQKQFLADIKQLEAIVDYNLEEIWFK